MLLLDSVVSHRAGSVTCAATATEESVFYRDGSLPGVVAMEYMAQGVAALVALEQPWRGPRLGLLVGVRGFDICVEYLPLHSPMTICAEVSFADSGVGQFECSMLSGEQVLARATLTVAAAGDDVIGEPSLAEHWGADS